MELKKNKLNKMIWNSLKKLTEEKIPSEDRNFALVLLFVKIFSDKFKYKPHEHIIIPEGGSFKDMVAWKNKPEIGDKINKVIGKLAEANHLKGVIDIVDFNDSAKLCKGKEIVDRLTSLISVFEKPSLEYSKNEKEVNELLGLVFENLLQYFVEEPGTSKRQYYIPDDVSQIMTQVIGLNEEDDQKSTNNASDSKNKKPKPTIYDPICGSGSLLIQAAKKAGNGVKLFGQEIDTSLVELAKMNMIIHNHATADILPGDSLSSPSFKKGNGSLKTFDFAVANPPFGVKNWANSFDPKNDAYHRFEEYGVPPKNSSGYAFLLHLIKSLKSTGKGAIILPNGVLFRGNIEAKIRKIIIEKGYIKGIIGLPTNLFIGSSIPVCIIVLDKEEAKNRQEIFMIDASKRFDKEGAKNSLSQQDIRKITYVFNNQIEIPNYSRGVNYEEIKKNDYNLDITRYMYGNLQLISVQSRKGGVGKTTVAYNVARTYLKKDNKDSNVVLVMDLDFFGTDITVSMSSDEWFGDKFIVKKYTNNKKQENVNLLKSYNDYYRASERLLPFSDTEKKNTNRVDPDRVNLIGSSSHFNESTNGTGSEQSPSVLFDPIVGYHFIRFVFQLVQRFYDYCVKQKKDAVIVFDNSPGHIGFIPMLEDYLLDFGPVISKFLFVCTNHESDMKESFKDIRQLHNKLIERIKICDNPDTVDISAHLKNFINNLHDKQQVFQDNNKLYRNVSNFIENHRLSFYANKLYLNEKIDDSTARKYIGLLINKVSPEIITGEHSFDIVKCLKPDKPDKYDPMMGILYTSRGISDYQASEIYADELVASKKVNYPDDSTMRMLMVPWSELLEWPYLSLQKHKIPSFEPEDITRYVPPPEPPKSMILGSPNDLLSDLLAEIDRNAEEYHKVIERMRFRKLDFIARLIPVSWSLSASFNRLTYYLDVNLRFNDNLEIKPKKECGLGTGSIKMVTNEKYNPYVGKYKIDKDDSKITKHLKAIFSILSFIYQTDNIYSSYKEAEEIFEEYNEQLFPVKIPDKPLREIFDKIPIDSKLSTSNSIVKDTYYEIYILLRRIIYREDYLKQFLMIVQYILQYFKESDKKTLYLPPSYIYYGNQYFNFQSITVTQFKKEILSLERATSQIEEFETVIKRIKEGWQSEEEK